MRDGRQKRCKCNWWVPQADRAQPALAIGFVGATSAGKSWLVPAQGFNCDQMLSPAVKVVQVSKLQSEGAAQPARFEQSFVGGGVIGQSSPLMS